MKITKAESRYFFRPLGTYYSSSNPEYGYIPIWKNASTYCKDFFKVGWNWTTVYNYHEQLPTKKLLVCLRNPLERWISGVAEYFWHDHPNIDLDNQALLEFVSERIVFDEHTEPQVNFFYNLELDKLIFIKIDSNFINNLELFASEILQSKNWRWHKAQNGETLKSFATNKSVDIPKKLRNVSILNNYLKSNPLLEDKIREFYEKDFSIYESVTYYGKT
jgi:hypothetical protein